ncbi:MAG: hypothetical protein JW852_07840, partial [Spirochaetales bacterium]|nr:hypothetical protein [Spirochaetales bacterium]
IYSGTDGYDVWYDVTADQSATKPAGATQPNDIRVNANGFSTFNGNRQRVTTATRDAINAEGTFQAQLYAEDQERLYILPYAAGDATDTNPQTMDDTTVVATITTSRQGGTGSTWNIATLDSSGDVGKHVSIVSNGTDKLYVAYYDFDEANLRMARVSWNSGTLVDPPTVDGIVNIDNYLSAGTLTNIMLLKNDNLTGLDAGTPVQPMIAYYSDSYNGTKKPIRFAFPKFDATTGSLLHGTTSSGADDTYSGNWEVITIPAVSTPQGGAPTFNRVHVGAYSSDTLPVLGWFGSRLEYGKLMPNY